MQHMLSAGSAANCGNSWNPAEEEEMPRPGCPTPPYPAQMLSQDCRNNVSPADSMAAHRSDQARLRAHVVRSNQTCGLAGPDSSAHPQDEDDCSSCDSHRLTSADGDNGSPDNGLSVNVKETSGNKDLSQAADDANVSRGHAQQAVGPCKVVEADRQEDHVSDDGSNSSATDPAGSQPSSSETGRSGQASIIVRGIEDLDSLSGDELPGDDAAGASPACSCTVIDSS